MFGLSSKLFASRKKPERKPTFRPWCEALERRDLMATLTGIQTTQSGGLVLGGGSAAPTAAGLAFLSGLPDTPVRATALYDYKRDGVIGRSEMLDILSRATAGYTWAPKPVYDSLMALVNNGPVVAMPAYVQDLAFKTVSGANAQLQAELKGLQAQHASPTVIARFQAQAPATLAQDISAEVKDFFLGQLHPAAPSYVSQGVTITPTYQLVNLPLFSGTPYYQDVQQGRVGDCWLMASLAEVAYRNPGAIRDMFIDNGDGTYTMRLYNGGTADYVTVDKYLPENPSGATVYEHPRGNLWVALAEKAYAEENATGWVGSSHKGVDSYQALDGGYPQWALSAITGQAPVASGDVNADAVMNAWLQGKYVVLCTGDSPDSSLVVPDHCYALVNYASSQFTLYNPWGMSGGTALSNHKHYPGALNVPCPALADNFDLWARAGAVAGSATPQAVAGGAFAPTDARPAVVAQDQAQPGARRDTQDVPAARARLTADSGLLVSLLSLKDRDGAARPASSDAAVADTSGEPGAV
jgi:hypothetical protein